MAILTFSKGEETNLPENRNEDNIYITSDTGKGFLGDKQLWVTPTELNDVVGSISNRLDIINGEVI
nr:MAG TPA: hypothetical protein [Bacteriophage sp.]